VTIKKGSPYGETVGPLPADGVVVRSDAEARHVVEEAFRSGRVVPPIGLLGGDLCHTLGGSGDEAKLRSVDAVTFSVDLGEVLADGKLHRFVAHLVARTSLWRQAFLAMNAQWLGEWNLGPRAHPNDGLIDSYDASLHLTDLRKVRARLPAGAHLPHPRIHERRAAAVSITFDRPRWIELDGERVVQARNLAVRVEPDSLRVVV
jgi:hypothetical protein